jgi:hypothetical protein
MSTRVVSPRLEGARPRVGLSVLALLALVLQVACITTTGAPRGGHYAHDNSVSAACRQNPANCAALSGREAAITRIAEAGTTVASIGAALRVLDNLTRASIEQALAECANLARSEVLLRYPHTFKDPAPDADECNAWTVDATGRSVTWAMRLGTEMHEVAARCAQEQLSSLRPGGFSVESRYRYDSRTGQWKQVSPQEERALEESGNRGELRGSLKPDVVIHSGNPSNVLAVYDFKFPCINPRTYEEITGWERYPRGHSYQGQTQEEMYNELLGANNLSGQNAARIVPRWGVIR